LAADFGLEPAPKPRRKRAREMAATLLEVEGLVNLRGAS